MPIRRYLVKTGRCGEGPSKHASHQQYRAYDEMATSHSPATGSSRTTSNSCMLGNGCRVLKGCETASREDLSDYQQSASSVSTIPMSCLAVHQLPNSTSSSAAYRFRLADYSDTERKRGFIRIGRKMRNNRQNSAAPVRHDQYLSSRLGLKYELRNSIPVVLVFRTLYGADGTTRNR